MNVSTDVFKYEESASYCLRELYRQYGYSLFKVNQFEEYDLYAGNKSFLVSPNVLTFTDTNGKLLALKPDVTLSIIKNIPDEDTVTHKFCYNETVYRTSAENDGFREIMQTGLECIGRIDRYAECEVILLAMRSLKAISSEYLLDISHMGILDGLLEDAEVNKSERSKIMALIESKNSSALRAQCVACGVSETVQDKLCALTELYLPIEQALAVLKPLVQGEKMTQAYGEMALLAEAISACGLADRLYVDFSMVNDLHYYDGLVFKGFINGIPDSVLSGGRYDRLLKRLGKSSGAIGFAVYLDRLERLNVAVSPYDVDTVLLYDPSADVKKVLQAQQSLIHAGKSVMTALRVDASLRYRQLLKVTNGGIEILEIHD